MTISEISKIVAKGNQLDSLIALRDRLASALDIAETARDTGLLSKQLVEVLEQIALIKPAGGSVIDELGTKREERRREAALSEPDTEVSQ